MVQFSKGWTMNDQRDKVFKDKKILKISKNTPKQKGGGKKIKIKINFHPR